MPAPAKGPRLWLRKARRGKQGRITHPAVWIVIDGKHQESTGCGPDDRSGAERSLEAYLNRKYLAAAEKGVRDPNQIPIADVLALYGNAIAHRTLGRAKQRRGSSACCHSLATKCSAQSTGTYAGPMRRSNNRRGGST